MATTPQTTDAAAARRAHAQAELRAIDAATEAQRAQAAAEAAEQEVVQRQAQARYAELAAQVDALDRYAEEQRQQQEREWHQAYERRQAAMEQLRTLANAEVPHVPRSLQEYQADLAQLDAFVDRAAQAERDKDRAYIDQAESRRLWDHAFRARYDFHHPGGLDGCTCVAHRRYRGED